jgi:alpha-D-ribose 1-methylphosphonate 5-triphosphate synthase subunit PhnL
MANSQTMIELTDVSKTFVMHLQGGCEIPVVRNVTLDVHRGECVVLGGASGAGKSSILKMIFGSYRCDHGCILIRDGAEQVDVARAVPRRILDLRSSTLGYVSQFLRVIPRVSALDIVAHGARMSGMSPSVSSERARTLLARLSVPERLWSLPPATFSGGEQQRVNIARAFAADRPILLMDEPTASLDAANRTAVVDLLAEAKSRGTAILGIFHDEDTRARVADRVVDVSAFAASRSN